MRLFHIVKVIFDRRRADLDQAWFDERFRFFAQHTLRSLELQTTKDWCLWINMGVNMREIDDRVLTDLVLEWNARNQIMVMMTADEQHEPTALVRMNVPEGVDYVYVTRIDSDDLYAPDALEKVRECLPTSGSTEASMFRRGYMHDVRTGEVGVYHSSSTPFHTLMMPRDVFMDPVRYKALDYGDHSKVNSTFKTAVLPDWRFTVLIHDRNFLSTMAYANERDALIERGWTYERFLDQPVVFDIDDFSDEYNCLSQLCALKNIYRNFRCTLFTIPQKTSQKLLAAVEKIEWIELALHGVTHSPNEELKSMSGPQLEWALKRAMLDARRSTGHVHYAKGFRPPGWFIQREHVEACNRLGLWVALHVRDEKTLGPLCQHGYYVCKDRPYHHAHSHDTCNNGIQQDLPMLLTKWNSDQHFSFVSDAVLVNPKKRGA